VIALEDDQASESKWAVQYDNAKIHTANFVVVIQCDVSVAAETGHDQDW
jgi:hypothetical protein